MESIHKRAPVARIVVGLVALVSLLAVSSAQGSMGTSKTLLPTNRPALTSVTISGPNVNYCFATPAGQAITGTGPGGAYSVSDFSLGGYAYDTSENPFGGTVVQLNNSCVQATFPDGELAKYSYGGVAANAVNANIGGSFQGNLRDSLPLIGSDSHNGTRGLTTGPDLQTAIVDGANSRISYVFDEDVSGSAPLFGPGGPFPFSFHFLNQAGGIFTPDFILNISGNIVTAQFAAGVVSNATVAYVDLDGAQSNTLAPTTGNVPLSVKVPGSLGNTNNPNLVSAALVGTGTNQVDFVYDTNVVIGSSDCDGRDGDGDINPNGPDAFVGSGCFQVYTSDSQEIDGIDGVVLADGKTVRVTFPAGTGQVTELLVAASAAEDAVVTPSGSVGSSQGGVPIGGNAGAFSTGYVTGPDAQSVTIDGSSGAATVTFDQRVDPATISLVGAHLVNSQGTDIGAAPSTATVSGTSTPGPVQVVYQFDPTFAASAVGLRLDADRVSTFDASGNISAEYNVAQVLAK